MNQTRVLTILAVISLWLNGTVVQSDSTAAKVKIACVGDSITYGANVDPSSESYPAVLQKLLGDHYEVHNYGAVAQTVMKGTGASFWDTQQFKDATALNPDIVTIMLGTNDSKGGDVALGQWAGAKQYAADYAALISHFVSLPSHPRIWAILPVPAYGETAYGIRGSVIHAFIVPLVRQIAAQAHVPTMDLHTPLLGRPEDFPDDVHPNKDGQARMAQVIHAYLTGQPVILPAGGLFVHPIPVTLSPTVRGTRLHYTTDSSTPTATSPVYVKPFLLAASATVKAAAFGPASLPHSFTAADFSLMSPSPASHPTATAPGLAYSFFHNPSDNALAEPDKLTAIETGIAADPGQLPHTSESGCGFLLTGYIRVPQDGVYSFSVGTYATSIISLDDVKVAESGGIKGFHLHSAATGRIGLAAGLHKIALVYSQADGTESGLSVRYAGPGLPIQSVPANILSH